MLPEVFTHYKVGIKCIDDGHWGIIELADKLIHQLGQNDLTTSLVTMNELVALAEKEFSEENHWMVLTKYLYSAKHVAAHDALWAELVKVKERIEGGDVVGLAYTLQSWQRKFADQIDRYDFDFVKFVQKIPKEEMDKIKAKHDDNSWTEVQ